MTYGIWHKDKHMLETLTKMKRIYNLLDSVGFTNQNNPVPNLLKVVFKMDGQKISVEIAEIDMQRMLMQADIDKKKNIKPMAAPGLEPHTVRRWIYATYYNFVYAEHTKKKSSSWTDNYKTHATGARGGREFWNDAFDEAFKQEFGSKKAGPDSNADFADEDELNEFFNSFFSNQGRASRGQQPDSEQADQQFKSAFENERKRREADAKNKQEDFFKKHYGPGSQGSWGRANQQNTPPPKPKVDDDFFSRRGGPSRAACLNVLGMREGFTQEVLKKTYRELVMVWHPDRNQNRVTEASLMMQKINVAYTKLKT